MQDKQYRAGRRAGYDWTAKMYDRHCVFSDNAARYEWLTDTRLRRMLADGKAGDRRSLGYADGILAWREGMAE